MEYKNILDQQTKKPIKLENFVEKTENFYEKNEEIPTRKVSPVKI